MEELGEGERSLSKITCPVPAPESGHCYFSNPLMPVGGILIKCGEPDCGDLTLLGNLPEGLQAAGLSDWIDLGPQTLSVRWWSTARHCV